MNAESGMLLWYALFPLMFAVVLGIAWLIVKIALHIVRKQQEKFNKTHPLYVTYYHDLDSLCQKHTIPFWEKISDCQKLIDAILTEIKYHDIDSTEYQQLTYRLKIAKVEYTKYKTLYNTGLKKIHQYQIDTIPLVLTEFTPKDSQYRELNNKYRRIVKNNKDGVKNELS